MKVKETSHLHNTKVQGKAAGASMEAATSVSEILTQIKPRFSMQRRCPFIRRDAIQDFHRMRGEVNAWIQALKAGLTLLLEAKAAGNFKLKRIVIYM